MILLPKYTSCVRNHNIRLQCCPHLSIKQTTLDQLRCPLNERFITLIHCGNWYYSIHGNDCVCYYRVREKSLCYYFIDLCLTYSLNKRNNVGHKNEPIINVIAELTNLYAVIIFLIDRMCSFTAIFDKWLKFLRYLH